MRRTRKDGVAIGFTAFWLTFWAGGMLAVLWAFGGAALRGELATVLFIAVWLAGAALAFWKVAERLRGLLLHGRRPRPRARDHAWHDGMPERKDR